MDMPTVETNFGAWGVWGQAEDDWTFFDLTREVNRAQAGGPLSTVPPTNPKPMISGTSNLIGANLKIAYWYAIAARYMEGNDVGAGWGADASTQAMGWSKWYEAQGKTQAAQRSISMSSRVMGVGVGSESEIKALFVKAAKWLEGWKGDPRGGLRGIGAILRSIGSQTATAKRRAETGGRGTTVTPDPPGDWTPDPRDYLPEVPKVPFVPLAIIGGVVVLGAVALATRK